MKNRISLLVAASLVATAVIPSPSYAIAPIVHPPVVTGGGGGSGAGGAGGIIGVAAFFVIYDLIRRTTCSGDFLALGGPGFSTKIKVTDTVLIPRVCHPVLHKKHRKVLHAKG
jgi:hypothetical protein